MAIVDALNVFKNPRNISKTLFLNVMLIISGCDSFNKEESNDLWKDLKITEYNYIKEKAIPMTIGDIRIKSILLFKIPIDTSFYLKEQLSFDEHQTQVFNNFKKLLNKYEDLKLPDNPEDPEKYIDLEKKYFNEYIELSSETMILVKEYMGLLKNIKDLKSIELQELIEKEEAILEENKKSTEHKNNMIKYNKEIEELKKKIKEAKEDLKETRDESKRTQEFLDSLKKN